MVYICVYVCVTMTASLCYYDAGLDNDAAGLDNGVVSVSTVDLLIGLDGEEAYAAIRRFAYEVTSVTVTVAMYVSTTVCFTVTV